MRTLDDILQSTSAALFPAELGARRVAIGSRDCDGDTPLHVLLWRRDRAGALELIAAGADVNAVGDMGETPLHVAVRLGDPGLVRRLLEAGSDPRLRSEFGHTPHAMAAARGDAIAALFRGR